MSSCVSSVVVVLFFVVLLLVVMFSSFVLFMVGWSPFSWLMLAIFPCFLVCWGVFLVSSSVVVAFFNFLLCVCYLFFLASCDFFSGSSSFLMSVISAGPAAAAMSSERFVVFLVCLGLGCVLLFLAVLLNAVPLLVCSLVLMLLLFLLDSLSIFVRITISLTLFRARFHVACQWFFCFDFAFEEGYCIVACFFCSHFPDEWSYEFPGVV